ncbi:XRE family transcriptional regulator [Alloscardovia theropitheci]|uniref:XRE family transcriptional regulator n=1 Tax=Alloscardovia theropitheci TaxID=2496842 RepID=A0A4R0QWQ7_9BIFI|nr:helix-turn-helix transcriptional regulator [Alloscardovia theropitheci]TCD53741.1 XRE family transcriptional regulator [Alloscardovia theropitheci]
MTESSITSYAQLDEERKKRIANTSANYAMITNILKQLTNIRSARGMTQADVAEEMDVTQGYVSRLENGSTSMFDNLVDYAYAVDARIVLQAFPMEDTHAYESATQLNILSTSITPKATPKVPRTSFNLELQKTHA